MSWLIMRGVPIQNKCQLHCFFFTANAMIIFTGSAPQNSPYLPEYIFLLTNPLLEVVDTLFKGAANQILIVISSNQN